MTDIGIDFGLGLCHEPSSPNSPPSLDNILFCFRSSAKSVPILAHGCWVTSEAIKSVNYYYQLLTGRGKESSFGGGGWRLEQKITQLKSVSVSVSVSVGFSSAVGAC